MVIVYVFFIRKKNGKTFQDPNCYTEDRINKERKNKQDEISIRQKDPQLSKVISERFGHVNYIWKDADHIGIVESGVLKIYKICYRKNGEISYFRDTTRKNGGYMAVKRNYPSIEMLYKDFDACFQSADKTRFLQEMAFMAHANGSEKFNPEEVLDKKFGVREKKIFAKYLKEKKGFRDAIYEKTDNTILVKLN